MSNPHARMAEAQIINYGFLAVNTCATIRKLIAMDDLLPEDEQTLTNARGFLTDAVAAMDLVENGTFAGEDINRCLTASNYALKTIENFQGATCNFDVVHYLRQMRDSLDPAGAFSSERNIALQNATRFFDQLNTLMHREVKIGRRCGY